MARELEEVKWEKFKLGDLFRIKSNLQLNKNSFIFSENGEYPYFTRTVFNNGILRNVHYLDEEHKLKGNCLAVGMIAMRFFYMDKDFYAGQFTKRAIPIGFSLNSRLANYFITVLNKKSKIFQSSLVRNFEKVFKNEEVKLPVKNDGSIDFEFMTSFISELEARQISELEAYLVTTGLSDYVLTSEEEKILEIFRKNKIEWKEFKIVDLFEVKNTGSILSRDIVLNSGKIPYLSASRENNAVSSYISYDLKYLDKGNCVFIGGKTFVVTYQKNDFYSNDSHNLALYFKNENQKTKLEQLFFVSCIEKSLSNKYSWENSISNKKIQNDTLKLPVINGKIDFEFMETLISAIQKEIIKDVVLYTDKKIKATKKVVSNK